MRTVLHLSPSVRLLGARQSLLHLVTNLDARRWRPVVVVPFRRGGLADALSAAGVARCRVRMGQWRKAKFWPWIPWYLWRMTRIARREDAAVVHVNEPHALPYGLHAARRLGIPCVVHVRLDNVDEKLARLYHLGEADRIVAVSEAVAEQVRALLPDRAERVTVIVNGVDFEALTRGAPTREDARRMLGLGEFDRLVAQVGLLSPRKRSHVLLEAFALIAREAPWARLMLIGSPGPSDRDYAVSLQAEIERRGLVGRAQVLPFREDIAAVFAAMDVNVLASAQEGFGRVLVEAAAFRVPSVGTCVGGIPEVIVDGETGLLVAPDDPEALAGALSEMLADEGRLAAMGHAARTRAEREFSIRRHSERMMALFDEVVSCGA